MSFRITAYAPGSRMGPHLHEEPWFVVVARGSYDDHIRRATTLHKAGHMLFYPAYNLHSQQIGAEGALKIVWTPDAALLDLLRESNVDLASAPHLDSATVAQLAARVLREHLLDDAFSPLAREGLLLEMAGEFGRSCVRGRTPAPPLWLKSVHDYLRLPEHRKSTHCHIAKLCGRHPVHVAKQFRRYYGTTLGGFQRSLQLEQARAMLPGRKHSIAEVSAECGFASQAHFNRIFKAAYGVTPGGYRKSI